MMKFRKKPVVIDAIQYTGTNGDGIINWANPRGGDDERTIEEQKAIEYTNSLLHIKTLEGTMVAIVGDWIIKGIAGEYYPCKPAIFEQTYEAVE